MNFYYQYGMNTYQPAYINKTIALTIQNDTNQPTQLGVWFLDKNNEFKLGTYYTPQLLPGQIDTILLDILPPETIAFWVEEFRTGRGLRIPIMGEVTVGKIRTQGSFYRIYTKQKA